MELNVVNFFRIAKSNGPSFVAGMKQFVETAAADTEALAILKEHPSLKDLDATAVQKLGVLANFTSKLSPETLTEVSKYIRAIKLIFGTTTDSDDGLSDSDILKGPVKVTVRSATELGVDPKAIQIEELPTKEVAP